MGGKRPKKKTLTFLIYMKAALVAAERADGGTVAVATTRPELALAT